MKTNKDGQIKPVRIALVLIVLTTIIICFAPGMSIIGTINFYGHLSLDRRHMWCYSILVNLFIFVGLYFAGKKRFNKALINYVIISFAVIALTIFLLINIRLDYTRTYSEFIGIVYNAK